MMHTVRTTTTNNEKTCNVVNEQVEEIKQIWKNNNNNGGTRYPYNGVLLNNKRKKCNNMVVLKKIVLSKRARKESVSILRFHLHGILEQENQSTQTNWNRVDGGGTLGR